MFQVKDFRSIVASMINVSRAANSKITDYSVGSVARTLMEAPAIEIEELYLQMLLGLQEAIPAAVFTSFSFARVAAIPASGTVRFSCVSSGDAILIPAGSLVKSDSSALEYATAIDVIIAAGNTYVDALASCTTPGIAGNCAAGSLTTMVNPISGVTTVANALALINGADAESDAARKTRFQAYISTLSRGTVAALRYGASLSSVTNAVGLVTEKALHVTIVEPYLVNASNPVGLVNMYIHNGTGATSAELVSNVKRDMHGYVASSGELVPGWKAAGVQVDVFAAQEVSVPITAVITTASSTAKPATLVLATSAVREYIRSLAIGASVIKSELIAIIMELDGVYNVVMTAPAADVSVTSIQKAMPGAIALS